MVRFCSIFTLFSSLFDQSANVYQNLKARHVLMCLPLKPMLLRNEYNNENITNSTLEPDLVPFYTVASLIQSKFQVMCRRFLLDKDEYRLSQRNEFLEIENTQMNEN